MMTVDARKKRESGTLQGHSEGGTMRVGTVNYVDRYLTTMGKLCEASKAAINQYGSLDELPLPDALYHARDYVYDNACYIQQLELSAELFHPDANEMLGMHYLDHVIVEKILI